MKTIHRITSVIGIAGILLGVSTPFPAESSSEFNQAAIIGEGTRIIYDDNVPLDVPEYGRFGAGPQWGADLNCHMIGGSDANAWTWSGFGVVFDWQHKGTPLQGLNPELYNVSAGDGCGISVVAVNGDLNQTAVSQLSYETRINLWNLHILTDKAGFTENQLREIATRQDGYGEKIRSQLGLSENSADLETLITQLNNVERSTATYAPDGTHNFYIFAYDTNGNLAGSFTLPDLWVNHKATGINGKAYTFYENNGLNVAVAEMSNGSAQFNQLPLGQLSGTLNDVVRLGNGNLMVVMSNQRQLKGYVFNTASNNISGTPVTLFNAPPTNFYMLDFNSSTSPVNGNTALAASFKDVNVNYDRRINAAMVDADGNLIVGDTLVWADGTPFSYDSNAGAFHRPDGKFDIVFLKTDTTTWNDDWLALSFDADGTVGQKQIWLSGDYKGKRYRFDSSYNNFLSGQGKQGLETLYLIGSRNWYNGINLSEYGTGDVLLDTTGFFGQMTPSNRYYLPLVHSNPVPAALPNNLVFTSDTGVWINGAKINDAVTAVKPGDGSWVYYAFSDGRIYKREAYSGATNYLGTSGSAAELAVSDGEKFMAVRGGDGTAFLFDLANPQNPIFRSTSTINTNLVVNDEGALLYRRAVDGAIILVSPEHPTEYQLTGTYCMPGLDPYFEPQFGTPIMVLGNKLIFKNPFDGTFHQFYFEKWDTSFCQVFGYQGPGGFDLTYYDGVLGNGGATGLVAPVFSVDTLTGSDMPSPRWAYVDTSSTFLTTPGGGMWPYFSLNNVIPGTSIRSIDWQDQSLAIGTDNPWQVLIVDGKTYQQPGLVSYKSIVPPEGIRLGTTVYALP